MASRAPPPSAVRASCSVAAPRAIASPCCAARQARADLVGLARSQPRRGDLGGLVVEQVEPAGDLARVEGRRVQQVAVLPPALDGPRHRRPQVVVPAPAVEQVALPALVEQSPLVVLAVDLDERPDLVGEARRRHGRVVEARRGPPRGRDLAHRDERLRLRGRTGPRRGRPRRRGGRASCRRGRRGPARAHR